MSWGNTYRADPGAGEEHHSISRVIGANNRRAIAQVLVHDVLDWGNAATGNVLNAIGADGTLGNWLTCEGYTYALFKLEISATGAGRRVYAVHRDGNATPLAAIDTLAFEVTAFGPVNGFTGLTTKASGYYHAGLLRVPIFGAKQVTLLVADGLSTPSLHAWGAAV